MLDDFPVGALHVQQNKGNVTLYWVDLRVIRHYTDIQKWEHVPIPHRLALEDETWRNYQLIRIDFAPLRLNRGYLLGKASM